MPNKPYSKAEIEILLSARNKKNIKLANRSKRSIRSKLIALKLLKPAFKIKPHKKKVWTKQEIDALKSSSNARNIRIPGRSRQSIFRMAIRLGVLNKMPARKPWKKKEIKILLSLIKINKKPKEIFKMKVLPYSRNSIQKKMQSLGFSKKAPQTKKFPEMTLVKFKSFLKNNWQGKTLKELVDLWNANNSFKIKKNKVIYHLKALKIKVSKVEIYRTKNLKKKEEEIISSTFGEKAIESLRKIRAENMRQRLLENKDIWTGIALESSDVAI